ncbi:MAG: VOC family protein [Candidatus Nitrosocosmicus sp.]|nr:VOC family protein [Candidatus Nitrosocosmicus sp.]
MDTTTRININGDEAAFVSDPFLNIDHVHLKVSNLENSVHFYKSILGFDVVDMDSKENTVYLGLKPMSSDNNEISSSILILTQTNKNTKVIHQPNRMRKEAGLFHFAVLLPERKYLAAFLQHIQKNLDPQFYEGMADHAVSESIYLHDPDNNGLEVYRDRKPSEWKWLDQNKVYMVTEPLDVQSLSSQHGNEKWTGLPVNTSIGHVHLHVSNLAKAKKFYQRSFGLYHTATYPGAYFFAANGYHHHIATNTWIGTNLIPNSANDLQKPGLAHFAIRLSTEQNTIERLKNHLTKNGVVIDEKATDFRKHENSSFYVYDQDGIKIQLLFE